MSNTMNKVKQVFSHHSDSSGSSHEGAGAGAGAGGAAGRSDTATSRRRSGSGNHLYGSEGNTVGTGAGVGAGAVGAAGVGAGAMGARSSGGEASREASSAADDDAGAVSRNYASGTDTAAGTGALGASHGSRMSGASEDSHLSPIAGGRGLSRGEEIQQEGKAGSIGRALGSHSSGHGLAHADHKGASDTDHDYQHLQHVTHNDIRHMNTEEVERQREHERHVHHVQHHVQPVRDVSVGEEQHHIQQHPVTNISETHSSTTHDKAKYSSLGANHKDHDKHRPEERTIVDLGERVNEHTHHHIHNVIQPVIEREVQDRHRTHTVIPMKHTTHEAPIIHESVEHEPQSMKDYLGTGGGIDSGKSLNNAGLIHEGDCSRTVEGTGEDLAKRLHLKNAGEYDTTYGSSKSTKTA